MSRISSSETFSSEGPQCPYCGCRITPDEGFYYDESSYTEDECPDCEKVFKVETHTSTTWACKTLVPQSPETRSCDGMDVK